MIGLFNLCAFPSTNSGSVVPIVCEKLLKAILNINRKV